MKHLAYAFAFSCIACSTTPPAADEAPVDLNPAPGVELPSANSDSGQRKLIEEYAVKNNLKGEFTPSGLYVVIENPGSGDHPTAKSVVNVEYTGYLLNGQKFDGTEPGKSIEIGLFEVIPGWTEGFAKFKKGGKGKLIIPSALGYGPTGQGPIPPSAVLVFDIKLVDFK